jgi:hypothetical protein
MKALRRLGVSPLPFQDRRIVPAVRLIDCFPYTRGVRNLWPRSMDSCCR